MSRASTFHRWLDRYCGIPLAAVAGLVTRRAELPAEPRRVGVIAASAIGDTVLLTGLLDHLAKLYPSAHIHLFIGKANAPALDLLATPVTAHVCDFTTPWASLGLVRSLRLDVLVDPTPWPRLTALFARGAGARVTLGYRSHRQHRHWPYNRVIEHSVAVHETENLRRMASAFSPLVEYRPVLRAQFPEPAIGLPYSSLVLMHVHPGGSRAAAKSWPVERWIDLAQRLCDDGYAVGFTGSKADVSALDRVLTLVERRHCVSLAGKLNLGELAHVMKRARLVITVDTAVLHIASALDRPMIALHGPTRAARWGARNLLATSIDAAHPAAGYINFGFEDHPAASAIMPTIGVDDVYTAAIRILSSHLEVARVS